MQKHCDNCDCVDYCMQNGYCIAQSMQRKFDADMEWEREEAEAALNVPEIKEERLPEVEVPVEIFKQAIKG